jgi:hypothetical protein
MRSYYFNVEKSNIIIEEGEKMEKYSIKNPKIISQLLNDIQLRDLFKINGIGMLGIKTISIMQLSGIIEFICYRIDTTEYF